MLDIAEAAPEQLVHGQQPHPPGWAVPVDSAWRVDVQRGVAEHRGDVREQGEEIAMSESQVNAVLQQFNALQSGWDEETTFIDMRRGLDSFYDSLAQDIGARVEAVSVMGVPCESTTFGLADNDLVIVYFHGGGYVVSSPQTHRDIASHLAKATGARVLNVGYRLAPEHLFPAALEDAEAVYRSLLEDGCDPGRIVLAGDSAGGGLAAALLVKLRDAGVALPAGAALLCPWADLGCTGESYVARADHSPVGNREMGIMMGKLYLGEDGDPGHPYASPVHASLKGLPPLFVQACENEVFLDDARTIARNAEQAGVRTELHIWPGLFHTWQIYASALEEAQQAIDDVAGFVASVVS